MKKTKRWISPSRYAKFVYCHNRKSLLTTFPDGIGITFIDDKIIRIENTPKGDFLNEPEPAADPSEIDDVWQEGVVRG